MIPLQTVTGRREENLRERGEKGERRERRKVDRGPVGARREGREVGRAEGRTTVANQDHDLDPMKK